MVNVFDVAERANVSSATVSRVLSGSPLVRAETKARVIAAAQALGYQPNAFARSLRMGRGSSVALVTGDIEHGIYPRLAKHLQRELELIGLSLVPFNPYSRSGCATCGARRRCGCAAFLARRTLPHDGAAVLCGARPGEGRRDLSVSQRLEQYGIDSTCTTIARARDGVRHMLERGRKAIAYLAALLIGGGSERAVGYEQALRQAGLAVDPASSGTCARLSRKPDTARPAWRSAAACVSMPSWRRANCQRRHRGVARSWLVHSGRRGRHRLRRHQRRTSARRFHRRPRHRRDGRARAPLAGTLESAGARRSWIRPTLVVRDST